MRPLEYENEIKTYSNGKISWLSPQSYHTHSNTKNGTTGSNKKNMSALCSNGGKSDFPITQYPNLTDSKQAKEKLSVEQTVAQNSMIRKSNRTRGRLYENESEIKS